MDEKKKVLVVDDDINLRTVLVDKLNASGFEAMGAEDGAQGLDMALATHPDIILLDVMMPKKGGWEVLKELRADAAWGSTAKVVMLTVLEDLSHVAHGVEYNVSGYLIKTNWSLDDVVGHVRDALGK